MSWEVIVALGIFFSLFVIADIYNKHRENKKLEQKRKEQIDLEKANKRKRLELLEKFKQITEIENEINELLFGYRDNNIIFNLKSLTNYLEQKEVKCYLETLYPANVNGPHIKLTIEFKLTVYTVFIKVYDNTDTVKIEEVLRKLKD